MYYLSRDLPNIHPMDNLEQHCVLPYCGIETVVGIRNTQSSRELHRDRYHYGNRAVFVCHLTNFPEKNQLIKCFFPYSNSIEKSDVLKCLQIISNNIFNLLRKKIYTNEYVKK